MNTPFSEARPLFGAGIDPPRPASAFWSAVVRLLWAEYRQMRGFWIALLGLALAAMQLLRLEGQAPTPWFYATAWVAVALYAVAAASTQFSREHEERTHGFLQTLPLPWSPLLLGKLLAAAAGTLMMLAVLLAMGYLAAGQQLPTQAETRAVLTILGPALLEGLAWGTFFSLLLDRPLLAAVLAIVAASVSVAVLTGIVAPGTPLYQLSPYHESWTPRILISCTVLLIDLALARDWLTAGSPSRLADALIGRFPLGGRPTPRLAETQAATRLASRQHDRPMWRVELGRLIWQTWRESRWTMAALAVVVVPVEVAWFFGLTTFIGQASRRVLIFAATSISELLLCPIALWGSCVYLADHRNHQARFLAEHGARSRYVYLARHIVWLGTLTATTVILGVAVVGQAYVGGRTPMGNGPAFRVLLLTILPISLLSFYAVGQLTSMTVRSGIVAGFLAVVISAVLAFWSLIMMAWDLSPALFVLPITAGMLLATWLRAPDWMIERHSLRAWARPVIGVGLPLAVVLALVPVTRLAQVDVMFPHASSAASPTAAIGADFALSDSDRLAARKTADDYLKLCDRMVDWTQAAHMVFPDYGPGPPLPRTAREAILRRYLQENRDLLQPAIAISHRRLCRFPPMDSTGSDPARQRFGDLRRFVKRSADNLLEKGQLDQSLDCYLAVLRMTIHARGGQTTHYWGADIYARTHTVDSIGRWARHANQTSQRLKHAIKQLRRAWADTPDPRTAVLADEAWLRDVIEEKRMPSNLAISQRGYGRAYLVAAYLANRLPWERTRAVRVLRGVTERRLATLYQVLDLVEQNQRQSLASVLRTLRGIGPVGPMGYFMRTDHLLRIEYQQTAGQRFEESVVNERTRQRGLTIGLALLAYRLDHATYPGQLDALVPAYLDRIPGSPYGDGRFQYEPAGWDGRVRSEFTPDFPPIQPHQPFLWSPGLDGPGRSTLIGSGVPSTSWQADAARYEEVRTYRLHWPVFVFPLPVADQKTTQKTTSDSFLLK